jgi:hypothetical protein
MRRDCSHSIPKGKLFLGWGEMETIARMVHPQKEHWKADSDQQFWELIEFGFTSDSSIL